MKSEITNTLEKRNCASVIIEYQKLMRGRESERKGLVKTIIEGFQNGRPVIVRGHEIPKELIESGYRNVKKVFDKPKQILIQKYGCEHHGFLRGYLHDSDVAVGNTSDTIAKDKGIWQVGIDRNVFPDGVPEFGRTVLDLYKQLERVTISLLEKIASHFGKVQREYIKSLINDPSQKDDPHVLWFNYYPPIPQNDNQKQVRGNTHKDAALFTVLMSPSSSGLEIRGVGKDADFIPVNSQFGDLILLVGAPLEKITDFSLPATIHRVVGDSTSAHKTRISIAFFLSTYRHKPVVSFSGKQLYRQGGGEAFFERLKKLRTVPENFDFQTYLDLNTTGSKICSYGNDYFEH